VLVRRVLPSATTGPRRVEIGAGNEPKPDKPAETGDAQKKLAFFVFSGPIYSVGMNLALSGFVLQGVDCLLFAPPSRCADPCHRDEQHGQPRLWPRAYRDPILSYYQDGALCFRKETIG
jgi:hypothetical protein